MPVQNTCGTVEVASNCGTAWNEDCSRAYTRGTKTGRLGGQPLQGTVPRLFFQSSASTEPSRVQPVYGASRPHVVAIVRNRVDGAPKGSFRRREVLPWS